MFRFTSILLADDNPTTNYLNQLLLKRLAVTDQLLTALNGQEALALLQTHSPAATTAAPMLVLLDVKMPVINGFGFMEAYALLPGEQKQNVIIIILSTLLHSQDVARIRKLNIAGFLNKPLTEEKINTILHNHFKRVSPSAQL